MEHSNKFLPFALPYIGDEEINEVIDTLRSGWLTTGTKAKKFEDDTAQITGADHALAVNSATAGLHLALEAIGVGPGDKVITTPYTFTATAEVIRYLGADPLFVDIDPRTFNIAPEKIIECLEGFEEIEDKKKRGLEDKRKIEDARLGSLEDMKGKKTGRSTSQVQNFKTSGSRVSAIVPVHFAGQACDMDRILKISKLHNLKIVEDAAHALPTTYKGRMIGTIGDLTVYSFYVTKTIATGEGGMVLTDNPQYAERIRTMRLHGISRDVFDRYNTEKPNWHYQVVAPGFKYNMPDIAASIGIHQLKKVYKFQERRQWIGEQYTSAFADLPLRTPYISQPDDLHAWHLYVIQLELEELAITRDRFIELMSEAGIGTSVHFIPLHIHPYWRDRYGFKPDDFPVAYDVYKRAVSLPIYPKMTDGDVGRVTGAVRGILTRFRR